MDTLYYDITGGIEVISLDIQESYGQPVSRCSIQTPDPGSLDLGDWIDVDIGFDGDHGQVFGGYITNISAERLPGQYTIEASDILIRAVEHLIVSTDLDNPFRRTNITAEDLVGDLLEEAGITSYSGDVTSFTLATGEVPVEFQLTFAWDAVQMVADIVAWHCYADYNGDVYFQDIDPVPDSSSKSFTTGSSGTLLLAQRSSSTDNLRNKVVVFGASGITAVASSASAYLPAGFYKTAVVSSTLIDTQAMADLTASYNLSKWNRLTENMAIEATGDYSVHARDTVTVTESFTNTTEDWFVRDLSHSFSNTYTMRLNLVR